MYAPYRSLGLVCDGATERAPPCVHQMGAATFLTTPVSGGSGLHLYDINLQLKRVSTPFPLQWSQLAKRIQLLTSVDHFTFVALGSAIGVLQNLKPVRLLQEHEAPISMLVAMAGMLFSACEQGRLIVWNVEQMKVEVDMTLPDAFIPVFGVHPPTYMNKVLLASDDGRMVLVNVRTKKVIYSFKSVGKISSLSESPLPDVVAIGTATGHIILHNIRFDETLFTFQHSDGASVTALTFRTDSTLLLSASLVGDLFVWDLPNKRLISESHVHTDGIGMAHFLRGESAIITAGVRDNSVKVLVWDEAHEKLRELRAREGHRLPPTIARFCGYNGAMLISAGLDREVRMVSVVKDARNREMKQGLEKGKKKRRERKLEPVVQMAACEMRMRDTDFANLVTVHEGDMQVYTWRVQDGARFGHVLVPPEGPEKYQLVGSKKREKKKRKRSENKGLARSVVVTGCGNFAVVGYERGEMHMYNLQSGRHVGAYKDDRIEGTGWGKAHKDDVGSMCVDGVGEALVSGGRGEKAIKFWNVYGREFEGEVTVEGYVDKVVWCKWSDLLAVACEDWVIYVYDASSRQLARRLRGHVGRVTDLCFGGKGRKIISGGGGEIRSWDLPTGKCVDIEECENEVTSLDCSEGVLASTHVNEVGIRLWVEAGGKGRVEDGEETVVADEEMSDSQDAADEDTKPLDGQVATLSAKPAAQWTVLGNLQAIKERNKPKEKVKKSEEAPFFLPTVKGLQFKFDVEEDKVEKKKVIEEDELTNSEFGRLVAQEQYGKAGELLRRLDASGVDLEIRSLDGARARRNAANFFVQRLEEGRAYELTQAYLGVFLNAHGRELAMDEGGVEVMQEVLAAQKRAWSGVRKSVESVLALSAYFSGQI